MKIEVIRHYFSENYTIGKLFIDGSYFCDTLEPSVSIKKYAAVALGSYVVNLVWSQHFQGYLPRIEVPNRYGILFHIGYNADDTRGCVLLGRNTIKGAVTSSTITFNSFMPKLIDAFSKHNKIVVEFKNK